MPRPYEESFLSLASLFDCKHNLLALVSYIAHSVQQGPGCTSGERITGRVTQACVSKEVWHNSPLSWPCGRQNSGWSGQRTTGSDAHLHERQAPFALMDGVEGNRNSHEVERIYKGVGLVAPAEISRRRGEQKGEGVVRQCFRLSADHPRDRSRNPNLETDAKRGLTGRIAPCAPAPVSVAPSARNSEVGWLPRSMRCSLALHSYRYVTLPPLSPSTSRMSRTV